MRKRTHLLLFAYTFTTLAMLGCGEDNAANTGNEVVELCSQVICPPGTTRFQDSSAEGQCSGSGSLNLLTESGEVSGQCMGSGECLIICLPPEPCCSGEKWTTDSYSCDTPCAASACADELPKCSVADGDEVVLACDDYAGTGVLSWGEAENCTAEDKTCATGAGGAFCAECDEDSDCDDGDPCTAGETCNDESFCQAGTPVDCDDDDPCNGVETCDSDEIDGCVAGTPLTCDDGDACNGVETCESDTIDGCAPGTAVPTDDGVECTVDACDPATGEVTHTPTDALCDDSDPCTDDLCAASEGCGHDVNNAPCDDGLECTALDMCSNGTCAGTSTSYEATVEGDYGSYAPVAVAETDSGGLILFHMGADQTVHATRYGPLGDTLATCQITVLNDTGQGEVVLAVVRAAERISGTDAHVIVGEDEDENSIVALVGSTCSAETFWMGDSDLHVESVAVAANGSMAVVGWQSVLGSTLKSSFFLKLDSGFEQTKFETTNNQALRRVRYLDDQAADGGGEGFVAVGSNIQSDSSCAPSCFGFSSYESSAAVSRWSLGGTLAQYGSVSHFDATDGLSSRSTYARDVLPPAEGGDGYILVGQSETPGAEGPLASATYAWIGKTNVGLNQLEWSELHGDAHNFSFYHRFNHVAHNASQDGYVASGTRVLDVTLEYHDVWTAQLSSTGTLIDETLFGGGGDQTLSGALTLGTGLALAALKTSAEEYQPYAAWLIRTDTEGATCSEP